MARRQGYSRTKAPIECLKQKEFPALVKPRRSSDSPLRHSGSNSTPIVEECDKENRPEPVRTTVFNQPCKEHNQITASNCNGNLTAGNTLPHANGNQGAGPAQHSIGTNNPITPESCNITTIYAPTQQQIATNTHRSSTSRRDDRSDASLGTTGLFKAY